MRRIDCRQISGDDLTKTEQIRLACDAIVKDGYVILDHVVPEQKIAALDTEFRTRYPNYLQDNELADMLRVGDRRYMIPVNLSGGFADPLIYANPYVAAVAKLALGPDTILESFGAFVSLAGAEEQHIHRDSPFLFDAAIAPLLPAHALTLAIPLIDMNDSHGTTALWPASHRWKERNDEVPPIAPDVPAGSCMLWDFRLLHRGTENRSERHRPVIHSTYARRWYQDPTNFAKKALPRVLFPEEFLESIPEDRRGLFYHFLKTD